MSFLKRSLKLTLIVLILVLFLSNYYICEYFYPMDLDKWWQLKINIYAIILALAFILSGINVRGIHKFFLNLGVGFATSNIIDRLYFDSTVTTKEDLIMVIITVITAIITYKKTLKPNEVE